MEHLIDMRYVISTAEIPTDIQVAQLKIKYEGNKVKTHLKIMVTGDFN